MEKIRDNAFLQEMVDRTYDELIASGTYSYRRFVDEFDEVVARHCSRGINRQKIKFHLAVREGERYLVNRRRIDLGKRILRALLFLQFALAAEMARRNREGWSGLARSDSQENGPDAERNHSEHDCRSGTIQGRIRADYFPAPSTQPEVRSATTSTPD